MSSLSDDLRDELARAGSSRRCCRLAELSALFHVAGSWHLRGQGEVAVELDLGSVASARRAFRLLRESGIASEIRTYPQHAFRRPTRYQLHASLDQRTRDVLREAGVLSASGAPLEAPSKRVVGRSCCRGAYLRGALLGAASVSGPKAAQLELRPGSVEGAAVLLEIGAQEGIELRRTERRGTVVVYLRGREAIADLLAVAGASDAALRLDEQAVVAGTSADANRLANADEANVRRTVAAARVQLDAIAAVGLDNLPPGLREVAELRLAHPEDSLAELAARCDPPRAKASVQHRLAAIKRLADD